MPRKSARCFMPNYFLFVATKILFNPIKKSTLCIPKKNRERRTNISEKQMIILKINLFLAANL